MSFTSEKDIMKIFNKTKEKCPDCIRGLITRGEFVMSCSKCKGSGYI